MVCAGLALWCALSAGSARAGELEKASSAVHGSRGSGSGTSSRSSSRSSGSSSDSGGDGSDGDDGGDGDPLLGQMVLYTLILPFSLPHFAVEGDESMWSAWSIVPQPYSHGAPGYFAPVGSPEQVGGFAVPPERRRTTALQLSIEGMPSLAGAPGRAQGRLRLLTAYRLELDAAYALYVEPSDAGAVGGGTSAWVGTAHAAFRFAQGEHVQFRAGIGVRHWIDQQGSSLGIDGLYALDIYWGRPMTTSVELSGGTLGSAWAAEARGTVGVILGIGEIYGGYDALWIGSPDAGGPMAYLGGPVVGVKAYF
jgi:hypothetical protein